MDIRYLFGIIVCRQTKLNSRRPAMSSMSIAPYFPFCRIRITDQFIYPQGQESWLRVVPDKRFQPKCHLCGQKTHRVHSWTQRNIRDLNLASTQVYLRCHFRKIFCPACGQIVIEGFGSLPSLFPSDQTNGLICSQPVPSHDRQGGSRSS